MEENRRFSLTNLFIKIILVVVFILFTVWLLSLSTKGLSNSLDVLTNNIFSQNIEKMKEVGKEYFTLERLPEKVGEIKTLTLDDMYDKNLILELTDKNGNACSAKNSYVSVEKFDNEYQMKVYLECGEESDYIIVIMGCYDYCKTDICEFDKEQVSTKQVEYEYKKVTNGSWTDYGSWSDWSKVSVTGTDYRQVETKEVSEDYSYDKTITDVVYENFEATCPTGYRKTEDGTGCYKNVTNYDYQNPVCKTLSGYELLGRDGFTCTYSKVVTSTKTENAICPSGYTKSGNDCVKTTTSTKTETASCPSGYTKSGNSCVKTTTSTKTETANCPSGYTKSGNSCVKTTTVAPTCPTVSGYTKTSQNGFTCNYSKTTTSTETPECPIVSGFTKTSQNGFTCNYKANTYTLSAKPVDTGDCYDVLPSSTSKYFYKQTSSTPKYVCLDGASSCAIHTYITYDVYEKNYSTTTKTANCPSGYTKSGNSCVKTTTSTKTETASCLSGYTKSGNSCVKATTDAPVCPTVSGYTKTSQNGFTCNYSKTTTSTEAPKCPTVSGYTKTSQNGFTCNYSKTTTSKKDSVCPAKDGYTLVGRSGFTCNYSKTTTNIKTQDAVCNTGYTKVGNSCLKTTTSTLYKELIKNCPVGYKETENGNKCYKNVESTVTITETRKVTYYRYRVREYIGGTTDYKWSSSKEDKNLLNAGYKLTGKTR